MSVGNLFYSRQQGNIRYDFCLNKTGNLDGYYAVGGETKAAFLIRGIPAVWQKQLQDPARQASLRNAFDVSYFVMEGGHIIVKGRLLGGWDDEIHMGYSFEPTWLRALNKIPNNLCIDLLHFREDEKRYPCSSGKFQGTYQWVHDVGLVNKNDLPAARIGYYARHVDYISDKKPISFGTAEQSWHFNRSKERDGSVFDTRIVHTLDCLISAIKKRHAGEITNAFNVLGEGLHPLQDLFAHSPDFVTKICIDLKVLKICAHHHLDKMEADEPGYINPDISPLSAIDNSEGQVSQRYSNTKTMTYIYLMLFRLATEPGFDESGEYAELENVLNMQRRKEVLNQSNYFSLGMFMEKFKERLKKEVNLELLFAKEQKEMISSKQMVYLEKDLKRFHKLIYGTKSTHINALHVIRNDCDSALTLFKKFKEQLSAQSPVLDLRSTLWELYHCVYSLMNHVYERPTKEYISGKNVAELPDLRLISDSALTKVRQCLDISGCHLKPTINIKNLLVTVGQIDGANQLEVFRAHMALGQVFHRECIKYLTIYEQSLPPLSETLLYIKEKMTFFKKRLNDCKRHGVGELPGMKTSSQTAIDIIANINTNIVCHTTAIQKCRTKYLEIYKEEASLLQEIINSCLDTNNDLFKRIEGIHLRGFELLNQLIQERERFSMELCEHFTTLKSSVEIGQEKAHGVRRSKVGELEDWKKSTSEAKEKAKQLVNIVDVDSKSLANWAQECDSADHISDLEHQIYEKFLQLETKAIQYCSNQDYQLIKSAIKMEPEKAHVVRQISAGELKDWKKSTPEAKEKATQLANREQECDSLERVTITKRQGVSEDYVAKPMLLEPEKKIERSLSITNRNAERTLFMIASVFSALILLIAAVANDLFRTRK